jgi:catechol-2,3-dioxygenase
MAATSRGIPVRLGHVALRVHDVERSVQFYTDVVGLSKRGGRLGGPAFLGVMEDSSHELALFPLPEGAEGPDPGRVGMYHMAWEMSSFEELEALHGRLLECGARIAGYSDRQCNVMFLDPDGNELEAFWEPPASLVERSREPGGPPLPRLVR